MRKSILYTILTMIFLYFLWWLSGGTIIGIQQKPAPIDYLTLFFWKNLQTGAATVFEALSSFLNK